MPDYPRHFVTPPQEYTGTHLYSYVGSERNVNWSWLDLEPGTLDFQRMLDVGGNQLTILPERPFILITKFVM